MLVCIDAGHAKDTVGKRSPDGSLREYEFNRDIAQRLQAILKKYGIPTIFSCDLKIDKDTTLNARCKAANDAKADLFISIHANAYGNGSEWTNPCGWEIYHYAGSTEGAKLAKSIHAESCATLGLKDRGVKTGNFHVLKYTTMPAVLIEHGFYTNIEECEKLKDTSFRQSCAETDAKGILKYLGVPLEKSGLPYQIRIKVDALNVRGGPGIHYPRNTVIRDKKIYTIVEEQGVWGKLKSGAGWVSLNLTEKV